MVDRLVIPAPPPLFLMILFLSWIPMLKWLITICSKDVFNFVCVESWMTV